MGCSRLDAATYPDPAVAAALAEGFVSVRVDTRAQPEPTRRFHVLWTPHLLALHPQGIPVRETIGYLPPDEMLVELALMRGLYELRAARPERAYARLRAFRERFARAQAAPEAMYWEGIALYRKTGAKSDLWVAWRDLVAAYPASVWAAKTTLL